MDYKRKIDFAIKLLRSIPQDGDIEVSYSGGKDSDVILELTKMAGIPYRCIYKDTTIDPPGTRAHCREMGAEILPPKRSFYQLMCETGFPNRWNRHCCSELKEYKVCDRAIQGIRKEESAKRAARYKEPESCRLYGKGQKVRVYYPILEWTLEDVARFVDERGLKLAPVYYDNGGGLHLERRLGCQCCPLASRAKRLEAFKQRKGMVRLYVNAGREFLKRGTKASTRFRDEYEYFYYITFCSSFADFEERVRQDTLFGDKADIKGFLEDYFDVTL